MPQAPVPVRTAPASAGTWTEADLAFLDQLYRLQYKSRFNAIYYELRLAGVQVLSFWMEVVIAVFASGSGLASVIAKATGPVGDYARGFWPVFAILAAIAAIIRPIYAPGKKIEAMTRQHQGYQSNFFALQELAFLVQQEGRISGDHRRRYDTFYDRYVQLATDDHAAEVEGSPSNAVRITAEQRARDELPPERNWYPREALAVAQSG